MSCQLSRVEPYGWTASRVAMEQPERESPVSFPLGSKIKFVSFGLRKASLQRPPAQFFALTA